MSSHLTWTDTGMEGRMTLQGVDVSSVVSRKGISVRTDRDGIVRVDLPINPLGLDMDVEVDGEVTVVVPPSLQVALVAGGWVAPEDAPTANGATNQSKATIQGAAGVTGKQMAGHLTRVANGQNASTEPQKAPEGDAGSESVSLGGEPEIVTQEAAQTLADLTPCLGDRMRVDCSCCSGSEPQEAIYAWIERDCRFGWTFGNGTLGARTWTVLEHLEPVTPDEPPVGAGMLVDRDGDLWRRRGDNDWRCREHGSDWWPFGIHWSIVLNEGPLRPATPADLARHGVDEDGEAVGSEGASQGVLDIAAERRRQTDQLGYGSPHDMQHSVNVFTSQAGFLLGLARAGEEGWTKPWCTPRPKDGAPSHDDLVRAGALIAAAIDRLLADEQAGEVGA